MKKKIFSRWYLYLINSLVIFIVISYQACSQNYSMSLKSLELPPKCETGLCKTGQLNPDLDQIRPPTKVLFVVDNSRTMELSQKYLANGIKTLADGLHGFDAEFSIYSTTDNHHDKTDVDGNVIIADDKPVLNSTPFQSCQWTEVVGGDLVYKSGASCPKDQPITYSSALINVINPSLVTDLRFKSTDNSSTLIDESDKISNAIKSVGIDGSSTETGICSLVRSVYNDNSNKFFNKGDNAAMVVLSDEDDSSTPFNCLSRITQEEKFKGKGSVSEPCNPLIENCASVDYEVKYDTINEHHADVTMDYKCNYQKKKSDCPVGDNCTDGVEYQFMTLRQKVKYSCLSKVPYTVSFKSLPTYAYNLKYQCEKFEDGVSVGLSTLNTVAYSGVPPSNCVNGEEVSCDDVVGATTNASQKCLTGSKLYNPTCKLKCVVGVNPDLANKTYNDTDAKADERNLYAGGIPDLILAKWAQNNYPGYEISNAVKGAVVSSDVVEKDIDFNCSLENSTGDTCAASDDALKYSSTACGGMKVTSCIKKCLKYSEKYSSTSKLDFYIGSPSTDDKANFCNNTDPSFKFYNKKMISTTKYMNIQKYAEANVFPPGASGGETATVVPGSCKRLGWVKDLTAPDVSLTQTQLKNSTAKTSCDGNYSNVWDLTWDGSSTTALCHAYSDYHGITSGSIVYGCTEVTGATIKPALTKTFTHSNSTVGEDLCSQPLKVGDNNYLNLADYYSKDPDTDRSDSPVSCKIVSAKKNVIPSGVELDSKILHQWTYPTNVASDSSDANLENAFITKSTELFGSNGYFVSAIIRDSAEDAKVGGVCAPLGADQSYGEKYRSLVNIINSKATSGAGASGEVASICSSDYSKALSSVSKWITETARRSYFLSEVVGQDEILAVSLIKESTGEEKPLTLGIDYETVGNKINFINPNIDPKGWIIKYIYWEPKDNN